MNQQEILVNPYTAIRLFANTYRSVGGTLLTDRKYKTTREAWIASMFLIALRKHTGLDWWFTPVKNDGSPDFNCYSFVKGELGNSKELLKLEVFEWRNETDEDDFVEAVKKIKLRKIIDPNITLLCYVRKTITIPPVVELNAVLKTLDPRVKDIWYVGGVSADSKMWRIAQVYPNPMAIDIDYDEVLNTKEEHSFISSHRGKSDGVIYEPSGKSVVLTPEFDLRVE